MSLTWFLVSEEGAIQPFVDWRLIVLEEDEEDSSHQEEASLNYLRAKSTAIGVKI